MSCVTANLEHPVPATIKPCPPPRHSSHRAVPSSRRGTIYSHGSAAGLRMASLVWPRMALTVYRKRILFSPQIMADCLILHLTNSNSADDNTLVYVVNDRETSPKSRKLKLSTSSGLAMAGNLAATNNPDATRKAQVCMSNVPNIDATEQTTRARHTPRPFHTSARFSRKL